MTANAKNIVGWVLLAAGLVVILATMNSSYQYFTGKSEFPQLFKISGQSAIMSTAKTTGNSENLENIDPESLMRQSLDQAVGNALPAESINKTFNMIAWLSFAAFLVFAGGKVSSIGIQLISAKDSHQ